MTNLIEKLKMTGERSSALDARHLYFGLRPDLNVAIMAIFVLEGNPGAEEVRGLFESLPTLVPRMAQRLTRSPFDLMSPRWVDGDVDLDRHLRHEDWGGRGMGSVYEFAREWQSKDWDLSIPLWELAHLSGLEGDRSAIVLRVHHAVADGSALASMLGPLFDDDDVATPTAAPPSHPASGSPPPRVAEINSNLKMLSLLLAAALTPAPVGRIGQHDRQRNVAIFTVPRAVWRQAATDAGGNSNDLYLAMAANALRRAGVYGSQTTFRIAMPVNLRTNMAGASATNATGLGFLDLDGAARHLASLEEVRTAATEAKANAKATGGAYFDRFMSLLPGAIEARLALNLYSKTDALVTNVQLPGASEILGAKVRHIAAPPPIIGTPVGFSLLTVSGTCALSLGGDAGIVGDFDRLESAVAAALAEGIGSAHVSCESSRGTHRGQHP